MTETDSSVDPQSHQAQNSSGENCPCPGRGGTGTPRLTLNCGDQSWSSAMPLTSSIGSRVKIENTLDRHKFAKLIHPLRELASEPGGNAIGRLDVVLRLGIVSLGTKCTKG